jgi:hypothetical protein
VVRSFGLDSGLRGRVANARLRQVVRVWKDRIAERDVYMLWRRSSEPQFGPGGGLPGDYPGDSHPGPSRSHSARSISGNDEGLDQRTDAGFGLRSRLRLS